MSTTTVRSTERQIQRFWARWICVERPKSALITLRVLFFGLLTYDLWWIGLSHAPRYGAHDFNVPHLGLLRFLSPSPAWVGALYLVSGLLSLFAVFGMGGRLSVGILALLYNFTYLWSQADSYQHHYLLGLILILCTWAPLASFPSSKHLNSSATISNDRVRHAGYDALYLQMAMIYLWTAVAKTEPVWLSGQVIDEIIRSTEIRQTIIDWGANFGWTRFETFKAIAWGVMLGEYLAPILLLVKPLRSLGFFIIPWFHISVEWIGFDIELFSYYMLALNLCLLSPACLWKPVDGIFKTIKTRSELNSSDRVWLQRALWFGTLMVCAWSFHGLPVEGTDQAIYLGLPLSVVCLYSLFSKNNSKKNHSFKLLAPLSISLCMILNSHMMRHGDFGFDYYRMWGGDLSRRGEYEKSVEIYMLANQFKEKGPARHAALGQALLKLKRYDAAATAYGEDVLRWADLVQQEYTQGLVSDKAKQGLKRAYEGWAQAYTFMGQDENAQLIRQQLQEQLSMLKTPQKNR